MRDDWLLLMRFLAAGGLNTAFGYVSYAVFVFCENSLGVAA